MISKSLSKVQQNSYKEGGGASSIMLPGEGGSHAAGGSQRIIE
jgi:hypothetical protein